MTLETFEIFAAAPVCPTSPSSAAFASYSLENFAAFTAVVTRKPLNKHDLARSFPAANAKPKHTTPPRTTPNITDDGNDAELLLPAVEEPRAAVGVGAKEATLV